jgi:hypothetical protein
VACGPTSESAQTRSFAYIRAMSGLPAVSGPPRVIVVGLRSAMSRRGRDMHDLFTTAIGECRKEHHVEARVR